MNNGVPINFSPMLTQVWGESQPRPPPVRVKEGQPGRTGVVVVIVVACETKLRGGEVGFVLNR